MLVADAIAIGRDAERRHAVEIAGGEPSEPAIAERGVRLDRAQPIEIGAQVASAARAGSISRRLVERVEQQPADQEFDREVIDALFFCRLVSARVCMKILMTRSRTDSATA